MFATRKKRIHTPTSLLRMRTDRVLELVRGRLVEKKKGAQAAFAATRIAFLLHKHFIEQPSKIVLIGATFECPDDAFTNVRHPDVLLIDRAQLPGGILPSGHLPFAPILTVDVLSPTYRAMAVDSKVAEYLRVGVRQVWVVNPEVKTVTVRRADGSGIVLSNNAELSGEDVLPGFTCRISAFFERI